MESRTITEWFETIEDLDTRQRAVTNYHNYTNTRRKEKGTKTFRSLRQALWCAFMYIETPEGGEFWINVHDQLLEKQL